MATLETYLPITQQWHSLSDPFLSLPYLSSIPLPTEIPHSSHPILAQNLLLYPLPWKFSRNPQILFWSRTEGTPMKTMKMKMVRASASTKRFCFSTKGNTTNAMIIWKLFGIGQKSLLELWFMGFFNVLLGFIISLIRLFISSLVYTFVCLVSV